jgi:hypothetical protein
MPKFAVFLVGLWIGAGLVTFAFQYPKRISRCSGTDSCPISLAKGVVWSAIWPAYWIIQNRR